MYVIGNHLKLLTKNRSNKFYKFIYFNYENNIVFFIYFYIYLTFFQL